MGKRTSSAKMLNKEAKGNGSSVDQAGARRRSRSS